MNDDPIRVVRLDDAEAILRIYAPAVRETAASFELEPPTADEIRERIKAILPRFPWLVFEKDSTVLGYAYAGEYRKRRAYQWSIETSIYVDASARRLGVARTLYTRLFDILAKQGFHNAYAVITLPNPSSVKLHEALGFTYLGTFKKVGYKLGQWHDVGWWELVIQPHAAQPQPPIPFSEIDDCRRGL